MSIVDQLAKEDRTWQLYALKITGCNNEGKDLVQDMYLKMYGYPDKAWSKAYIYKVLLNLFRDQKRKEVPCISIEDMTREQCDTETDTTDLEEAIKTKLTKFDSYYSELALIHADGTSYRKISYLYKVHYLKAFQEIKKIKNKLRKDKELIELYQSIK